MAKKTKFLFNPETLSFEKTDTSLKHRFKRAFIHTSMGVFFGILFFFIFSTFIHSPKEINLQNENHKLELQYNLLKNKMDIMQDVLNDMQQRDDNLYRVLFQAEPLPKESRLTLYDNNFKYNDFSNLNSSKLVISTSKKADELEKQIYVQSKSFDEILLLAKSNEQKLKHIPAIQPILNKDLTRIASGFGYRMHPIYRRRIMHQGMDFTAPTGTDIYATGNGTVIHSGWKQGYGKTVVIDHGFGYKTAYAHMHKLIAEKGQKVNRGDIIGLVGNSGRSTGPHLHYEVIYNNKHVNPMNYYFLDLSPEEYDEMIQIAANAGRVLD